MDKIKIGISIGDVNGIGMEIILKTLTDKRIANLCTPVIYGSSKVVSYHKNIVQADGFTFHSTKSLDRLSPNEVNILNCWQENVNITLGKITDAGGKYAMLSLKAAVKDLKEGNIDALVTAPINKKAMQMSGFAFPGHTEYLEDALSCPQSVMLMVSDDIKIGLVTNHLPISKVAENITTEGILTKIEILHETLRVDFGISKPTIAVLGLNPHAGDEGAIGTEEKEIIMPAIAAAKEKGILAIGPYSADGFFGSKNYRKFDAILAMYHDQGLIPFKALSFGAGVNYTAGLPAIRTSPDHGTAYDITGQNLANPSSFRQAIFLAFDSVRNRRNYKEMHKNPIKVKSRSLGADEIV